MNFGYGNNINKSRDKYHEWYLWWIAKVNRTSNLLALYIYVKYSKFYIYKIILMRYKKIQEQIDYSTISKKIQTHCMYCI